MGGRGRIASLLSKEGIEAIKAVGGGGGAGNPQ